MSNKRSFLGPRVPKALAEAHPLRFLAPSLLLATAAGILIASIFTPYWVMVLEAPQYPGGLEVRTYLNRLEGDVREIDGLNHYIGMRPMGEAAQLERSVSILAIIAIALLVLGSVFLHNRRAAYLTLPAVAFPFLFLADLAFWLRSFGTNLDPAAPLSSSIKPFVPPVLGTGYVGQFATVAKPGVGLILALVAAILIVVGLYLHRRAYKPLVDAERPLDRPPGRAALLVLLASGLAVASAARPAVHVVSKQGARNLSETLALAVDGDTILVEGGTHRGEFELDKPLILEGRSGAVLEGGGTGTVVSITASAVEIRGLIIRGSGRSLDEENAGIAVGAPGARIIDNRLEDVLFGIYLREAPGAVIKSNVISGKNLETARRGDAIRVWRSDRVVLENNQVSDSRDVVLWYSNDLRIEGNQIRGGRYGLHFMYCDDASIQNNLLLDNSVGAFLMYSRRLRLRANTLAANHGPSGYGVGLKDMDDAELEGNLFVGNRVGVFLDNSPRDTASVADVEGNRFVGNDVGVVLLPNVRRARFEGNSFEENQEQVEIGGAGAEVAKNHWRRNYWSDYLGFDVDGDGFGEVAYRSEKLFENFSDRAPALEVFSLSLAARFLDFAARVLPAIRPRPKLVDTEPLAEPIALAGVPPIPSAGAVGWTPFSLALLLLGGLAGGATGAARDRRSREHSEPPGSALSPAPQLPAVHFEDVTKRFGDRAALDRVSFDISQGEAVALWGANGAGKTTALRAILGLAHCQGRLRVHGFDPAVAGERVRAVTGYVPQRFGFLPGTSVGDTLDWFARLRGVETAAVDSLLSELGLDERAGDPVETLSGGWQQRLALAVALVGNPPLLLLDEPSANLDRNTRSMLMEHLARLKRCGKTLIFASHRAEEVSALADRVIHLEQGRLVACGSVGEVLAEDWIAIRFVLDGDAADLRALCEGQGLPVENAATHPGGSELVVRLKSVDKAGFLARVFATGIEIQDFDLIPAGGEHVH